MPIPIIDLFAGPGGLGEGFSSYRNSGRSPFKVELSVEKDSAAHQTLKLRSFTRQFKKDIPEAYYNFVRNDKADIGEYLYNAKFKKQVQSAESEAINLTLGPDNPQIEKLIKERIGNRKDWVLIGGPPCQAYSLIGRARMRGQKNFAIDERHTLYENYLHMLDKFKPAVFVMENVKGILSSKVGGELVFKRIMSDLSQPGSAANKSKKSLLRYHIYSFTVQADLPYELTPTDFIIKAEGYGIPQRRHRVILIGIRTDKDVGLDPRLILKPEPAISVHDAIGDLPRLRSRISRKISDGGDSFDDWISNLGSLSGKLDNYENNIESDVTESVAKIISAKIDPGIGGRFTSFKMSKNGRTSDFMKSNWKWFHDEAIGGVLNHQSRRHMASDLQRYLFCSLFAQRHKQSPKLKDFPDSLLPNHKNVDKGKTGLFSDRFRVQLRDTPATTVTSHISKDGHYYIHYDPTQCRSLSVREAARLQTFPDNYFFAGNVTQQYHQVGNAVPPLLARKLADTVYRVMQEMK
jgi:DNA (cytosine-5)-methyltransferase 1